ncbi:MAG: hypothetical protein OEU95_03610 [Nitrospirota bacterium]|nr:hypothetical protein [Nitrospirota bacterium]
MRSPAKTDIKNKLTPLHEITNDSIEFMLDMRTAFIYNKLGPMERFKLMAEEYEKEIGYLSMIIREAASSSEGMRPYIKVTAHLMNIWRNLINLHDLIDKKIRENILFSDKGVNETTYLIQRLAEILRPAADMVLARNTFLKRYIEESQADIEKNAAEYATFHETRLITGECSPVASSLYLGMLEAIKNIAWNTKEMAAVLGK